MGRFVVNFVVLLTVVVVVVKAASLHDHHSSPCPSGMSYSAATGHCYSIPEDIKPGTFKTQSEAATFCQSFPDGQLLSVDSLEEQIFVEHFLMDRNASDWDFWTNGKKKQNGEWYWGDTMKNIEGGYQNWDEKNNQPDKNADQDCIFLGNRKSFFTKWHDNPCSYECSYICEFPAAVPPCPAGWTKGPRSTGSCYYLPADPQTDNFGSIGSTGNKCQSLHSAAHLVRIETEDEQYFIEHFLTNKNASEWDYWTDGKKTNGKWVWGDSGVEIHTGYVNWDSKNNQPDGTLAETGLFLGHRATFKHRWHDHRSAYQCSYICELCLSDVN